MRTRLILRWSRQQRPADGVVGVLRDLMHDLLDPYRPERHYMRGPGPKWWAKHGPRQAAAGA
jgi:hypothetical protein